MPRILIVEDVDAEEELSERVIHDYRSDIELDFAGDGKQAIEHFFGELGSQELNGYERPDLVLLDVEMPVMDGIKVLKRLKAHDTLKVIPVVMFANSDRRFDEALKAGANSFVVKEYELEDFREQMASIIDYWLGLHGPDRDSL